MDAYAFGFHSTVERLAMRKQASAFEDRLLKVLSEVRQPQQKQAFMNALGRGAGALGRGFKNLGGRGGIGLQNFGRGMRGLPAMAGPKLNFLTGRPITGAAGAAGAAEGMAGGVANAAERVAPTAAAAETAGAGLGAAAASQGGAQFSSTGYAGGGGTPNWRPGGFAGAAMGGAPATGGWSNWMRQVSPDSMGGRALFGKTQGMGYNPQQLENLGRNRLGGLGAGLGVAGGQYGMGAYADAQRRDRIRNMNRWQLGLAGLMGGPEGVINQLHL